MEDLLHGDTRWLASAITVAPVPTGVPGGITSEEEEEQLDSLNEWIAAAGLPRGVVAYDFSDTESGEQKAVFDLVWPNGIQEELSQPVAVLLNEEVQTLALGQSGRVSGVSRTSTSSSVTSPSRSSARVPWHER